MDLQETQLNTKLNKDFKSCNWDLKVEIQRDQYVHSVIFHYFRIAEF